MGGEFSTCFLQRRCYTIKNVVRGTRAKFEGCPVISCVLGDQSFAEVPAVAWLLGGAAFGGVGGVRDVPVGPSEDG
jgi:hypothetical protein